VLSYLALSQQSKKIVWITELILDTHVHRTSRIEILRHLAERGYEVHLLAIWSKKRYSISDPNVHICCFPLRYAPLVQAYFFSAMLFLFLPVFVLLKKPQFIIAEPGPSILAFMWKPLLSSCLRLKVILDIRSTPVESSGWLGSLKALMFNISVLIAKRIFDGLTIITTPMKEEISRKFHIDPESIGVWTSGVSTTLFEPTKYVNEGLQLRDENALTGKFVVFYHGALTLHRGIIESVKSIEILKSKYDDIVFFLLGNGPALPVIRTLIQENCLQDKVIVHDVVNYTDVPKYIAMSDVGIVPLPDIPDWRYQCPLNLLEYLAMEKTAIITDIPGNRAIVGESKCGIYIPSADPGEIAEAIAYLRNEKKMLKEWGSCGRAIVKEKYDWRKVAEHLEDYLAKC